MRENEKSLTQYECQSQSKEELSLTVDEAVEQADEIIDKNGICLLLFDMIDSQTVLQSADNLKRFHNLTAELNEIFEPYLPENNLTAPERQESGFHVLLGDGLAAGINSSDVISLVDDYVRRYYPEFLFYRSVAVDGFDAQHIKIVK